MRKHILCSTLLTVTLSTLSLLATPGDVLAERYIRDRDYDQPRHFNRDRPRVDRSIDKRRYGNYPSRPIPRDRDRYRDYNPRYRYNGRPWFIYPDRHYYPKHRYHYRDNDFWGWLGFTVITLSIIDSLNEQQQRRHELTLREALRAPIGESIHWHDRSASGSVTVICEGTSSSGRYCREYTQEVDIGGTSQQVYGTACQNPDGSWEMMD